MTVALVVKVAAAAVLMENQPQRNRGMPVLFDLTVALLRGQRCQGKVHHLLIARYALVMLASRMGAQKT